MTRVISDDETFDEGVIGLRLVTPADCGERYLSWLLDPDVNRFLETRWAEQTLHTVRSFVEAMRSSEDSYLFAIIERESGEHVGNIKIGPINQHHRHADVSYFVGERRAWGRGYATSAIRCATRIAFKRLGLERVQAGVYEANRASARALEKAGYSLEGRFRRQLTSDGGRQDHLYYGILRDEFDCLAG